MIEAFESGQGIPADWSSGPERFLSKKEQKVRTKLSEHKQHMATDVGRAAGVRC